MKEEEQDPLDMTVRELFDIAEPGKGAQMIPMSFNEDKKVGRYLIAITGDMAISSTIMAAMVEAATDFHDRAEQLGNVAAPNSNGDDAANERRIIVPS